MPVTNYEIAEMLERLADLLTLEGNTDEARLIAYRRAARNLGIYPESARDLLAAGRPLTEIPGVGAALAQKIEEAARAPARCLSSRRWPSACP